MLSVFIMMVYAVALLYTKWEDTAYLSKDSTLIQLTVLSLISVVLTMISWVQVGNRFVSLFTMFYLYMFLSNVGQQITLIFPDIMYSGADITTRFRMSEINQWLLFQLAGLAATGFGAVFMGRQFNKKHTPLPPREQYKPLKLGSQLELALKGAYLICLAASFIFAIRQLIMRQDLSYDDFRDVESGTNGVANFMFSLLSYYFILRTENKKKQSLYLLPIIVLVLFYFAAGTRSRAIPLVMLLIFVLRQVRPEMFKKKWIPLYIVGVIAFLYFTNVISSLRENAMSAVSFDDLFSKSLSEGALNMIFEMGISTNCGLVTLRAMRAGSPHYQTLLYYFTRALIPSSILGRLGFMEPACGRLSDWATDMGGFTYSIGFSCLAESFVNFGMQGWIFMLGYGGLISWLESKCIYKLNQRKYLYASVVLTLLAKQVFFARAQFDLISTYLRFSFIVLIVWLFISDRIRKGRHNNERI